MLENYPLLDMSNAEYHGDTSRVSKSGLDLLAKSPAHYYQKYLAPDREPEERTPALIIGSATHSAILEPDLFAVEYCKGIKVNRSTTVGKKDWADFLAANEGKEVLAPEDYERILKMRDSVFKNVPKALVSQGRAEATLHFTHRETGVLCKARLDYLHESGSFISDIKTTEDASRAGFTRSIAKYNYHKQAAFYLDAFAYLGLPVPKKFIFVGVEKSPPYATAIYQLDTEAIALGRELYTENLVALAEARAGGEWYGYGSQLHTLTLPAWAFNQ